ncbi:MAG: LacI family transcriptional regulator [Mesorhizobium sp.]|nr:MAG: LacI family transcriptional regulator [Mesorhizobium sp.]
MPGRQHAHALGKSVAELLMRRLKGEMRAPERLVLPTEIIERGSVGLIRMSATSSCSADQDFPSPMFERGWMKRAQRALDMSIP